MEREGVLVTTVMPGSPAGNAGVQVGDVILQVNRVPVSSVQGVKDEVAKAKSDKPLLLCFAALTGVPRSPLCPAQPPLV